MTLDRSPKFHKGHRRRSPLPVDETSSGLEDAPFPIFRSLSPAWVVAGRPIGADPRRYTDQAGFEPRPHPDRATESGAEGFSCVTIGSVYIIGKLIRL